MDANVALSMISTQGSCGMTEELSIDVYCNAGLGTVVWAPPNRAEERNKFGR